MVSRITSTVQEKQGKLYVVIAYYLNDQRKQKWMGTGLQVKGNKRRAELLRQQYVKEFEAAAEALPDTLNTPEPMKFTELLTEWLVIIKYSIAQTTYAEYKRLIENGVLPYFNDMNLALVNVNPVHIQNFYNYLMGTKKVSANTVIHYHANLRKALDYAQKQGYISQNPAVKVTLPKKEKFIGAFYSVDELQLLLKAVRGYPMETPVMLTCYYGFRRGEVLALKWNDVDFKAKTISVTGTVTQKDNTQKGSQKIHVVSSVKTESSYRTLPLLAPVETYLLNLKKTQTLHKKRYGNEYITKYEDFICVQPRGDIIKPSYVSEMFKKFLDKNGLRRIRFHDLRHSCATMLLGLGLSLKDIQVWLGHGDYATTANIYAHVEFASKQYAGEQIANTLGKMSTDS